MGPAASLQRHKALRLPSEKFQHLTARNPSTENLPTDCIGTVRLKDIFCDIQPDRDSLCHGRLLFIGVLQHLPWHIDAVGGRPPHQMSYGDDQQANWLASDKVVQDYIDLRSSKSAQIIRDEVVAIEGDLSELTGLPVAYVDEKTRDTNISNLRIVLETPESAKHWITDYRRGGVEGSASFRSNFEKNTSLMSVNFTPIFGLYQVDGYFLSNENSEIVFSVCYIKDQHPETTLKKLVRECVLRSLGLPEIQRVSENSVLGPWNRPFAESVDLGTVEAALQTVLDKDSTRALLRSCGALFAYFPYGHGEGPEEIGLSDFDKEMVRVLYSTELKAGMTFLDVINKYRN